MKRELSPVWLLLLLLLIGCGWGLTIPLATIATSGGMAPVTVALWGAVLAFAMLSAYLLVRGERPPLDARHLRFYAIAGFLGTAFPHALSFHAAIHLPSGSRAIVMALIPMISLLLSIGLALERPNLRRFFGISIGFLAIALLFAPDATAEPIKGHGFWLLVSLIAAASYAVEGVYIVLRRPHGLGSLTALWGMNLAAVLMLGALVAANVAWKDITVPDFYSWLHAWGRVETSIVLMAVIHVGCYGALLFLLNSGGAVFASQVAYIVTPAAIFWGAILLSEQVTAAILVSTAMILSGLVLIRPNRRPPDPAIVTGTQI